MKWNSFNNKPTTIEKLFCFTLFDVVANKTFDVKFEIYERIKTEQLSILNFYYNLNYLSFQETKKRYINIYREWIYKKTKTMMKNY